MYNPKAMSIKEHLRPEIHEDSEPAQRQRLPYGAVPLDPWRATPDYQKTLYWNASTQRIERKLQRTMIDQDWFRNDLRAHALYDFMKGSLFRSHYSRLEHNNIDVSKFRGEGDERIDWGRQGLARPEELFTLLVDYPEINSIELAKLSHPFDFEESGEMDRVMDDLMLTVDGELLSEAPRYDLKATNMTLPAGMMLRKQDLMDFPTEDGTVRIVQRRGFLVFDGEDIEDPYFGRLLKNPKNRQALEAKIEWYLYDNPKGQAYGWVQPQATSYYAKYLKRDSS